MPKNISFYVVEKNVKKRRWTFLNCTLCVFVKKFVVFWKYFLRQPCSIFFLEKTPKFQKKVHTFPKNVQKCPKPFFSKNGKNIFLAFFRCFFPKHIWSGIFKWKKGKIFQCHKKDNLAIFNFGHFKNVQKKKSRTFVLNIYFYFFLN